ncbi:MAG: hypothetical protein IKV40_05870 [Clostridia bacterium]|nr:hypothetical protein [Clostridia bacterium]
MKKGSNEFYELDLVHWLQALWHKAWAIALAAVICAGIAFSIALFVITPKYEAETLMYVNNTSFSVGNTSVSISNSELSAAQSLVDTYIVILNSRTTLKDVIEEARLSYTYDELKNMLHAEAVNNTEIFSVKVRSEYPSEAELIANTIANVLPRVIASVVDGSDVRIVDYAVVPAEKASPNITLYTAVGLLIGFTVMCLIITIQEMTDTLIHSEDYLLEAYDLPVLAVVPDLTNSRSDEYSGYNNSETEEGKQ